MLSGLRPSTQHLYSMDRAKVSYISGLLRGRALGWAEVVLGSSGTNTISFENFMEKESFRSSCVYLRLAKRILNNQIKIIKIDNCLRERRWERNYKPPTFLNSRARLLLSQECAQVSSRHTEFPPLLSLRGRNPCNLVEPVSLASWAISCLPVLFTQKTGLISRCGGTSEQS